MGLSGETQETIISLSMLMIICRECARAECNRDHNSREGHASSVPVQGMKSRMQYRTSNLQDVRQDGSTFYDNFTIKKDR